MVGTAALGQLASERARDGTNSAYVPFCTWSLRAYAVTWSPGAKSMTAGPGVDHAGHVPARMIGKWCGRRRPGCPRGSSSPPGTSRRRRPPPAASPGRRPGRPPPRSPRRQGLRRNESAQLSYLRPTRRRGPRFPQSLRCSGEHPGQPAAGHPAPRGPRLPRPGRRTAVPAGRLGDRRAPRHRPAGRARRGQRGAGHRGQRVRFLAYGTTSVVARQLGAGSERAAVGAGVDGVWLALALGIPPARWWPRWPARSARCSARPRRRWTRR